MHKRREIPNEYDIIVRIVRAVAIDSVLPGCLPSTQYQYPSRAIRVAARCNHRARAIVTNLFRVVLFICGEGNRVACVGTGNVRLVLVSLDPSRLSREECKAFCPIATFALEPFVTIDDNASPHLSKG